MRKKREENNTEVRHFEKSVSFLYIRKIRALTHKVPLFSSLFFCVNPCYAATRCIPLVSMPRAYQPMPQLQWLEERLQLSDKYPSGLEWCSEGRYHKPGDMAGAARKDGRYYYVFLSVEGVNTRYTAHRIVYYLRTGEDPGNADVMHSKDNVTRDNRQGLVLYRRGAAHSPKWRRRVRDSEGRLVYNNCAREGISVKQLEREQGITILS